MTTQTVGSTLPGAEARDRRGLRTGVTQLVAERRDGIAVVLVAVTVVALSAILGAVGADSHWLAALGAIIAHRGAIPTGVPFAAAPTAHWANTLVLAQLIFHGLEAAFGDRGLMLAQVAAVAAAFGILGRDSLAAGGRRQGMVAALLLVAVGALPELVIARVQLFSLVLFPAIAALLRSEARAPSRRLWLVVPMLALWSNLHGAALVGLGMTGAYLALQRLRVEPLTAIGVGIASAVAVCLTPAGIHTIAYYHGVLTNQAAQQGEGLWAPLSLGHPLDVLLVAAAIALTVRLHRSGMRLWEGAVLAVLAVLTLKAGRSGVWLLFFIGPLAARTFAPRAIWDRLLPALATIAALLLVLGLARGPLPDGASHAFLARATALAHGSPILAEDLYAEQVALAGGRIVAGNPIDAFSAAEQHRYLAWLAGTPRGAAAVTPDVDVVITARTGGTRHLMARLETFRLVTEDRNAALFVRTR